MEALAEQLEMANERAERAERESEYFAAMMQAIAERSPCVQNKGRGAFHFRGAQRTRAAPCKPNLSARCPR
jgi:hypothetical protein